MKLKGIEWEEVEWDSCKSAKYALIFYEKGKGKKYYLPRHKTKKCSKCGSVIKK